MMIKAQKAKFVEEMAKKAKSYKTAGIMPIDALPDRLVQKTRNGLKPDTMFITGRKTLLMRITEKAGLKILQPYITGSVALVLSNKEPMELYETVSRNVLKLQAKPGQVAPSDIRIESGETSIAPGQAVTELKTAGIDVQIQKGKVIISKSKVLVPKGQKISLPITKALKTLDIAPFEAKAQFAVMLEGGITFTEEVFKINATFVKDELARDFMSAYLLTLNMGYVTRYNITEFIGRAFRSALGLGVEAKIPEGEAAEKLAGIAALQAKALEAMVPKTAPEEKKEEAKE